MWKLLALRREAFYVKRYMIYKTFVITELKVRVIYEKIQTFWRFYDAKKYKSFVFYLLHSLLFCFPHNTRNLWAMLTLVLQTLLRTIESMKGTIL